MEVYSTACLDWEKRIVNRQSLIAMDPLYPDEAEKALEVFKSLKVVDVKWVVDEESGDPRPPTFGEISEEWVFDFVRAIFGAYNSETGQRLINEFFLLISKKNSKSTIAAGIMVTALIRNWRHNSECLLLAPTQEVANNAYAPAKAMVDHDDELKVFLDCKDHIRTIKHLNTNTDLKIVAADSETVSGKKAAFIFVDELWLFGKRAKSDAMLMEATGGLVSRPEGFVVFASTHSDEAPAGVFKSKLHYFRDVRDGVIVDPTCLGVLYEWPKAMLESHAYRDPKNFYITNPNIDRSVSQHWLETEYAKKEKDGVVSLQLFQAKHLNVEVGLRQSRDRWRGADHWEAAADESIATLDSLLERSEVVVAGIDGGGLDDLLGLCVIGRCADTKRWLMWFRSWVFEGALDQRKVIESSLRSFAEDGDLTICSTATEDIDSVVEVMVKVRESGLFPEKAAIGLDPEMIAALVDALWEEEFTEEQTIAIGQGYRLHSAVNGLERKLADKTAVHNGSKMMSWCVGNAKTEMRGNAVLVTKQVSGRSKIDPLMACFNAVKLMERNPKAQQKKKFQLYFA